MRGGAFDKTMDRSEEAKLAFAMLLKQARKKVGLTQKEMAESISALTGIKFKGATYWYYEKAKNLPRTIEEKEAIEKVAESILAGTLEENFSERNNTEKDNAGNAEENNIEKNNTEKNNMGENENMIENAELTDDRTYEEQMEDLGVEVVKVHKIPVASGSSSLLKNDDDDFNKIKNTVWFKKTDAKNLSKTHFNFNGNYIMLHSDFVKELNSERVNIGVAEFRGQKVIRLQPSSTGYKISKNKKVSFKLGASGVSKKLVEAGIKLGIYEAKKLASGGYIGVLVEEKENAQKDIRKDVKKDSGEGES